MVDSGRKSGIETVFEEVGVELREVSNPQEVPVFEIELAVISYNPRDANGSNCRY
jgi:hypothetical protein